MTDHVLRTHALTKEYKQVRAVDNVNITLTRGRVYGLIGRNGAGKTSLMRLVTGLSIPTSGSVELFGDDDPRTIGRNRRRLGSLIEEPGLETSMSATQNMHLHRIIRGIPTRGLEQELLELVGLADAGTKKVRDFSLGMKKRLGIAIALLSDPELLVLDEPVNGLDPVGMVEIRELIRQLSVEREVTSLVSSHNLPELFQTATDYILMDQGQVKQTLTLEELETACQHYLLIAARDSDALVRVLQEAYGSESMRVMPDRSVRLHRDPADAEEIVRTLCHHDIYPTTIAAQGETLESYFLSAIGEKTHA